MEMKLRIEGADKVAARLNRLAQKIPKEADRIIEDAGAVVFQVSQELVPVDTGTLQRSGVHDHEMLHSEISYSAPYAAFVEFGTSNMEAQPYLRPAAADAIKYIEKEMKKLKND